MVTHPDAKIRYSASGMVLHMHGSASYLSETKYCNHTGSHLFLSNIPNNPLYQPPLHDPMPPNNGAILTNSTIMKPFLLSAAES